MTNLSYMMHTSTHQDFQYTFLKDLKLYKKIALLVFLFALSLWPTQEGFVL